MSVNYTTLPELRSLLKPDKGWREVKAPRTSETMFVFPLAARLPGHAVRVYSGFRSDGTRLYDDMTVAVCGARYGRLYGTVSHTTKLWEYKLRSVVEGIITRYPDPARELADRLIREGGKLGVELPQKVSGQTVHPK